MKRTYLVIAVIIGALALIMLYRALFASVSVKTAEVTRGNLVTVVYATGKVSADSLATLRSKSGGIVVEVGAREGAAVRAGAVLLRTDQKDRSLDLENAANETASAEVQLNDHERDLKRQKALFEGHTIPESALENAQRDYDLARIALAQRRVAVDIARQKLADTEVRAPFSGLVISSSANIGDLLPPNAECFQMVAPGSINVQADVAEQDISRLRIGMKAVVAFDAYPGGRFEGTLTRLVPRNDESTKTLRAVMRLRQTPENLTIGMTPTSARRSSSSPGRPFWRGTARPWCSSWTGAASAWRRWRSAPPTTRSPRSPARG
jgi:RND family efflux transporter MFP subunit